VAVNSKVAITALSYGSPWLWRAITLLEKFTTRDSAAKIQGDHFSGKPGNIRELTKSQGIVGEKILSGKLC